MAPELAEVGTEGLGAAARVEGVSIEAGSVAPGGAGGVVPITGWPVWVAISNGAGGAVVLAEEAQAVIDSMSPVSKPIFANANLDNIYLTLSNPNSIANKFCQHFHARWTMMVAELA